ncbi:MAG: hypothetical protein FWD17_15770, partial [Polyangiaceae bacterium]|nr:hypothetical protein [Polyangiaceae bacterium]
PLAPPRTLTAHPLPIGRVALSAGGSVEDGAAAAWVARERGDPEVNVARLDRTGRTIHEARLTRAKGDATDVALAWAGDGWIVAWVDGRDGNGEVYATKVDRDLKRVGREYRITTAPGDAGGVALAAAGDVVWIAWSDPRDSPREGTADIFVAQLRAADAAPVAASSGVRELRVASTARHSRSPSIAATLDGGALVGWIEAGPAGVEAGADAMIARIDSALRVAASPAVWSCGAPASGAAGPPLGGAHPSAIILARGGSGVRAVVACAAPDGITLETKTFRNDGIADATDVAPLPLLDLDAPPSFEVTLALAGDGLIFDDVGRSRRDHRVRRAAVAWPR